MFLNGRGSRSRVNRNGAERSQRNTSIEYNLLLINGLWLLFPQHELRFGSAIIPDGWGQALPITPGQGGNEQEIYSLDTN